MKRDCLLVAAALSVLVVLIGEQGQVGGAEPSSAGIEHFEKRVRPILVEHCYQCHSVSAKKVRGGLRVDGREALLKGGDSGPALVPGKPEASRFLEAVTYGNVDLQMPPKGKLPDAVISDLKTWVQMGAPWPREEKTTRGGSGDEFDLLKRKAEHWAWQPLRPVAPPPVKNTSWPLGPIDAFLLARLELKGLTPALDADRTTLLRRLYFDLLGLPPTPEEIQAFLRDQSPGAYGRVVERLLASPHFGERWGRHWLDLVRYAETRGHEFDFAIPNAYLYRDYVIRALNADLPYDQFVTEHIAGDLLERPRTNLAEGFNESILGTTFWFLGEEVHSPVDLGQDQADRFDNRLDVFGKAFLGMTIACARCHDHKFDAISQKDYYALFGVLRSCSYRLARFDSMEHNRRVAAELINQRAKAGVTLQQLLAESCRATVETLPASLLAAREVLVSGESVDQVAARRKLPVARLTEWVAAVRQAGKNPRDPLHLWARLASDPRQGGQVDVGVLEAMLKRTDEPDRFQVVVDYRRGEADKWFPDGFAFGPGPARVGEARLDPRGESAAIRFLTAGAAEYDRCWDVLKLDSGTENDPGSLGGIAQRHGRTLRTPTFPLTTGKVFYLVRGGGVAYASIGAHTMLAGPLHGRVITRFGGADAFRWITHDLTPYKGYPAHVEFTPEPGSDFAVALVVQAEEVPPLPDHLPVIGKRLRAAKTQPTVETLAEEYGRLFDEVREQLQKGKLADGAEAGDFAPVAQWLADHPQLLEGGGKKLAETVAVLDAEEKKITARIEPASRVVPAPLDGNGVDGHLFIRGSPKNPGERVPRRFLEALVGERDLSSVPGSGRRELAGQMTDPTTTPLLARVLVNRVWHHLFGRGIVGSVDNFGALGEQPSHPDLLDTLANRFIRQRWSIKTLIREIVLSRAYQMGPRGMSEAESLDPQNLLLHRSRLRRLEGEAIRDAMLTVSGRLDRTMSGPSVPTYLTPFMEGRGKPGTSGPLDGAGRRSIYQGVRRNFLSPLMLAFDTPSPFSTVGRRTVSNVPAQALILMNDPFVHQQAEQWAQRVLAQAGTAEERIRVMYLSAFGRLPTAEESSACQAFLEEQARRQGTRPDDGKVWKDLAHTLFNVKEFLFLG